MRADETRDGIPLIGGHHDAECVWCGGLMSLSRFGAAVHNECLAESAHQTCLMQQDLVRDLRTAWAHWEEYTECPSLQVAGRSGEVHTLELGQPMAAAVRADLPGFVADLIEGV